MAEGSEASGPQTSAGSLSLRADHCCQADSDWPATVTESCARYQASNADALAGVTATRSALIQGARVIDCVNDPRTEPRSMTHSTSIAGASASRSDSSWPDEPDDEEQPAAAASAASPAAAAAAATRGGLPAVFTGQLLDGSGAHTFGHVPLLAALSTHIAIVCSGLKSVLIG
jgi:hypothetical protein